MTDDPDGPDPDRIAADEDMLVREAIKGGWSCPSRHEDWPDAEWDAPMTAEELRKLAISSGYHGLPQFVRLHLLRAALTIEGLDAALRHLARIRIRECHRQGRPPLP